MFTRGLLLSSVGLVFLSGSFAWATPVTTTVGPYNVTFYNQSDTDGSTTGAANWTATQMSDITAAINVWDVPIANTPGRQVVLHMFWGDFGATLTLGSTSNPITGDGTNAWTRTERVWRTATNPGSGTDASITFSTNAAGTSWNFGTGTPTSSQIDFRSVATHEIGHTLGFSSAYQSGSDTFWAGGLTAWDTFLRDDAGNRPAVNSTGTPSNFNQLDNPVWFVGANAEAANGGQHVAIYAPGSYTGGSSLTHVDEGTFANDLMSPQIGLGQMARLPSELDWGIMRDIGWTVVPEPGIVALAMSMTSALLLRPRRRQQS